MMIEAVQYDGTNLWEVKELLSRQCPKNRITIVGSSVVFLRYQDRPDEPLIPGDWITLGMDEDWADHMSDTAFRLLFKAP